jgi:hypothetical protein
VAAVLSVVAALLAACSGPASRPAPTAYTAPVTGTASSTAAVTGAFAAEEVPSPSVTSAPVTTSGIAVAWCRSADLAIRYLGGDSTTVDPKLDVIERYRLTNASKLTCRAGAWVAVTMLGVSGCPAAPKATPTTTTTTVRVTNARVTSAPVTRVPVTNAPVTTGPEACPAGPASIRGQGLRSTAWPAHEQVLPPGGSTVLSLLFADTYAPQSCPEVWAPPARLELRPAGDPHPLVVEAKVYPCNGELFVAPLGFGL